VTVGHIAGGEAGYRGHAIKGIGQHLALRAHRWQWVEPWNAEMGDALRPNSICELERFHVMKRYTYARMVALNVGRQSGVSLAQSGRLVPALIGVPVTILYHAVTCNYTFRYRLMTSRNFETTFVGYAALLDQKASHKIVVFAVGNMVQYGHHKQRIRSYKRFVMITVFYVHLFAVAT
jgi:hypothetical protein